MYLHTIKQGCSVGEGLAITELFRFSVKISVFMVFFRPRFTLPDSEDYLGLLIS